MMEYYPEHEPGYNPQMPLCKPCKDPKIEEDAILRIMQLAIYGAVMQASEQGVGPFEPTERVVKLFKEAGLIK